MFEIIDYHSTRALQICIVFVATLAMQRWLQFSHAGWIGFAVMMIYAGFDAGSSIQRTLHRFGGAVFGLLLSFVFWEAGQVDYRLIIIIIPIIVFFAFFSLGKIYAFPTVFTVTLTALGTDYYSPIDYDTYNFFFDYFRATGIALFICLFFESIVFRKQNLTHKFRSELVSTIIQQLQQLVVLVSTLPLKQSHYLKLSIQCNVKIMELQTVIHTATYDYNAQQAAVSDLDEFYMIIERVYLNIRRLFVEPSQSSELLIAETNNYIERLIVMKNTAVI